MSDEQREADVMSEAEVKATTRLIDLMAALKASLRGEDPVAASVSHRPSSSTQEGT